MPDPVTPVVAPVQNQAGPSTFEKIAEMVRAAIDDLVTLEVTTIVGSAKVAELPKSSELNLGAVDEPKVIHSRIRLIDGDITTLIDESFIPEGELHDIRDFHQKRVEEGGAIIERNIKALKELLTLAREVK